jgi:hypothetical protein
VVLVGCAAGVPASTPMPTDRLAMNARFTTRCADRYSPAMCQCLSGQLAASVPDGEFGLYLSNIEAGGPAGYSPATRQSVANAARECSYVDNRPAR